MSALSKPSQPLKEPTTSRRERAKLDKRRRILDASAKLFALQGFEQTTVQQIADKADVAVGTLFLYVSDKGEILLLLFHEALMQKLEHATNLLNTNRNFLRSITSFLVELMSPYEESPELSRFFWREFLFHKGKVRADLDAFTGLMLNALHDRIVKAQNAGQLDRSIDPNTAALHIYALYHSTLAFHLADCLSKGSPKDTLEKLLKLLWQGLDPHPPMSKPKRSKASPGNDL